METTNDYFEALLAYYQLQRRPEQDKLVRQLYSRPTHDTIFVQAATGVGKSFALITDALRLAHAHHRPGIIVTPTNKLTQQYVVHDLPTVNKAIPHTFVRVMGRSHYVCADSPKGPGDFADPATRKDWLQRMITHRSAWKATDTTELVYATEFELAPNGLDYKYACPGYPDCQAGELGGCGAKQARARAHRADIVITNGHMLAIHQIMQQRSIELLPHAAVTHVDEAHTLPSIIRDCRTVTIDRSTGQRTFISRNQQSPDTARVDALRDAIHEVITSTLSSVRWDNQFQSDFAASTIGNPRNRHVADEIDWFVSSEHYQDARDFHEDTGRIADTLRTAIRRDRNWSPIVTRDNPREIKLVPISAIEEPLSQIQGAAVSATIPESLPAMYGHPDAPIEDVGHPFDYATQAEGFVSQHSGVKSNPKNPNWFREVFLPRQDQRLDELSAHIDGHPTLVLCSSHKDVENVAKGLANRGHSVFNPQGSGSGAAQVAEKAFRKALDHGTPGPVLVGTDTFATGMDLPGDLLTRVAWWTVPYGTTTELDKRIDRSYKGARRDWLRVKVAQGCGRLLRKHTDQGRIILCDNRFVEDYNITRTRHVTDRHLTAIDWEWID